VGRLREATLRQLGAGALAYLSRCNHRVAIGSGRLTTLDEAANTVTFGYKAVLAR